MTEDPRISEIRAVLTEYVSTSDPDALWDVRCRIRDIVDRESPAPRVFLPNDEVPVGTVITAKNGSPFRVPDEHTSKGMARVGVPFVEVAVPSPEEWQAAVDRAAGERESELRAGRHAELTEAEASEASQ